MHYTASVKEAGVGPPLAPLTFTPKSPFGPPGLWLADRTIPPVAWRCRIRLEAAGVEDAAGGDDHLVQAMGGAHPQDHINSPAVAVTAVSPEHQGSPCAGSVRNEASMKLSR